MLFTVLGAGGYIGSHLVRALHASGADVQALGRDDDPFERELGHVIDAAAVTNDAHQRSDAAARANVGFLGDLLRRARFESLLYLSSAQLYVGADHSNEDRPLIVSPHESADFYRISKIMGEAICRASSRENVRVARLSAVYGGRLSPRSFLSVVVRDALEQKHVELLTTLDSERDFIHIDDVTRILPTIAVRGRSAVYNVASGRNVTNADVVRVVQRETGCTVTVAPHATRTSYPSIELARIQGELSLTPSIDVLAALPDIIASHRRERAEETS